MSQKRYLPKTREEVRRNFRHSVQALELSSESYDVGFKGEAARLAGIIYVFVHDGGRRVVSLLSQTGRKKIGFVNSCRGINPRNLLTEAPLVLMRLGNNGFEYAARLGDGPPIPLAEPTVSFHTWWEMPVLRDNKRRLFSRKNLVCHMRHGEGGGHVDSRIEEQFADMERHNSMGWYVRLNDRESAPDYSPLYGSVRQIAWELHQTLLKNCQDMMSP